MMRSKLIKQLKAENPDLKEEIVQAAVIAFFDAIIEQLAQGGRVEIRDFGTFTVRKRAREVVRNPKTGKDIARAERPGPLFRAGTNFAKTIMGGGQGDG